MAEMIFTQLPFKARTSLKQLFLLISLMLGVFGPIFKIFVGNRIKIIFPVILRDFMFIVKGKVVLYILFSLLLLKIYLFFNEQPVNNFVKKIIFKNILTFLTFL